MDLVTPGRVFYPNYRMQLIHRAQEDFAPGVGAGSCLRMILVKAGSGIINVKTPSETTPRRFAFLAPVVFCLNEQEGVQLEKSEGLSAQSLIFHPCVLNSRFNFASIRVRPAEFNATDQQDRDWLLPFLRRGDGYNGQLHLGPAGARQATDLIKNAGQQMHEQPDHFWPCRTRSYLLELLFLLERLRAAAEQGESLAPLRLPGQPCEVEPVVLYLHTHYRSKITLNELTHAFHTNRTSLEDRFAALTGQPVMGYLINLRVRLAALMLRETRLPVSEVMERVGFCDRTHFGRTFRKLTGLSPRDYREANCRMGV